MRLNGALVADGPAERPGKPERDLPERPWSPEPEAGLHEITSAFAALGLVLGMFLALKLLSIAFGFDLPCTCTSAYGLACPCG